MAQPVRLARRSARASRVGGLFLTLGALGLVAACADTPAPPLFTRVPVSTATTVAPPTRTAPTLFPSLTPPPLDNRTPTPTPTPAPVRRQLTSGGCCVQPQWSPDGGQVWFLDQPSEAQPAGLWGVPVAGGEPQFITDRLGLLSPDGSLRAYPSAGQTMVERVATGEVWSVPAGGRAVLFSPDNTQLAWQTASSTVDFDRRVVEIWVAAVDGGAARVVAQLIGGGLTDWFPNSRELLVTGRASRDSEPVLAVLDVDSGQLRELVRAVNLRGVTLSPDGGWLAYQVAFSGDPAQDGLWVLSLAEGEAHRLPLFGAYRWRAEGRLLMVPLEPERPSHRLVDVDAASGQATALTDPAVTAFRIAAGDWALSPDGQRVVYVSAADHNLWLIELP